MVVPLQSFFFNFLGRLHHSCFPSKGSFKCYVMQMGVGGVNDCTTLVCFPSKGSFKCYVMQMGVGGVNFSRKTRYEGVRFNVISITRGWVGSNFPEKSIT